ncbi:spastin [Selaginella moellendorffii]|uniref:spastin n=1 Tax=Selaginella moellendorffii TaxID=88036 RepID=UPI000D1C299D|nr:spastin [Selaginella moellendorffii]|eukprot:XP_024539971.1 spastin [Selaginella moellendorffii]
MLSRLWERKSKVLKAKGSSDEPPKELEARPVENTDPPPKELEAKNTDPPPKQLDAKNTDPPSKEWEDRLIKSTDLTVSLDGSEIYQETLAMAVAKDLNASFLSLYGNLLSPYKIVLERCTRLVVYFPDPEDWFRRAVAITQRKEFLEKLQDKLDMLSGGIVLIASRINVENKSTRHPEHTGYYLEDIYSLFENKDKDMLQKWQDELKSDSAMYRSKTNTKKIEEVLDLFNWECKGVKDLKIPHGVSLTDKGQITYDEYETMLLPCVIAAGETGLSFRNVGGLKKVKATLQELLILPLTRPKLFSKGNLLKWYGEAEKLAKAVFTLAEKLAPTIIFVDEVDSILGARGELNEDETSRSVKNEFMTAWDGLRTKDDKRVMLLAATNRLDEAVIRRLPRRILISLPKRSSRVEILKVLLEGEKLDNKFDLEELGRLTTGYSGSDLKVCPTARFVNTQLEAWNQQYGEVKEKDMEIVNGVYQKRKPKLSVTCKPLVVFLRDPENWFGRAVKTPEVSENVKDELCKMRQQGRRGTARLWQPRGRPGHGRRRGWAQHKWDLGGRLELQQRQHNWCSKVLQQHQSHQVAAPPSNGTKQWQ